MFTRKLKFPLPQKVGVARQGRERREFEVLHLVPNELLNLNDKLHVGINHGFA
jgi:hypothetical protein